MSDHRINLTVYRLDEVMEGDLNQLIEPINHEYQADQLAAIRAKLIMQSIETVLTDAYKRLVESQSPSPRIDASVLLSHVLEKPSSYLLTWPEKCLTVEQWHDFQGLLERRLHGEPIAYIVGHRDFWDLKLNVSPETLIPRCDTELLVETALSLLNEDAQSVLDLGTGTGAIALSLAKSQPNLQVLGVDFNLNVALAQKNQVLNEIKNAAFLQSHWFDAIPAQKFSMIVSNPPYIDHDDPHLEQGDVRFEPKSALVALDEGLADIRLIVHQAQDYLAPKGYVLIEHGYLQGKSVREIFTQGGFVDVETRLDYAGKERITGKLEKRPDKRECPSD